jgi:signal peptidase II
MKRSPALLFGVAASSVALDQWTKVWATENLAFHEPIRVVGDLVRFTYTRNSGIAFGMFAGESFPFYIFSIVAAVAVLWLWFRHPHLPRLRQWSLALILGGAIGNLIDRLRFGEVTDFILLSWRGHEFPVFNVADVCVTCGVILFALVWSHEPHAVPAASDPAATDTADTAAATGETHAEPPAGGPVEPSAEEAHGPHAGAGGAGYRSGRPLGPMAGESSDRGPVA